MTVEDEDDGADAMISDTYSQVALPAQGAV
jgi:hypothetical protein